MGYPFKVVDAAAPFIQFLHSWEAIYFPKIKYFSKLSTLKSQPYPFISCFVLTTVLSKLLFHSLLLHLLINDKPFLFTHCLFSCKGWVQSLSLVFITSLIKKPNYYYYFLFLFFIFFTEPIIQW